jgi:hypothetical protein
VTDDGKAHKVIAEARDGDPFAGEPMPELTRVLAQPWSADVTGEVREVHGDADRLQRIVHPERAPAAATAVHAVGSLLAESLALIPEDRADAVLADLFCRLLAEDAGKPPGERLAPSFPSVLLTVKADTDGAAQRTRLVRTLAGMAALAEAADGWDETRTGVWVEAYDHAAGALMVEVHRAMTGGDFAEPGASA